MTLDRVSRVLNPDERDALKRVIDHRGENTVVAHIGLSRESIARAAAGLPVQVATLTHLRLRLAEMTMPRGENSEL